MISSSVCLSVLFLRGVRVDRFLQNMNIYKFHVLSITGMFLYVSFATVSTICFSIQCNMCPSRFFRFTKYLLLIFDVSYLGRGFPHCDKLIVLF